MVNTEYSITAIISGAIFVAIFILAYPNATSSVSQPSSFVVPSTETPEKTKAPTTSVAQKEDHLVKVFIDNEGSVHVIHTLKESENIRQIKVINGILSNLLVTGEDGSSIRYVASGKPLDITIFPTEKRVLIEYDLGGVLFLKNGRWTWDFFYSGSPKLFFPDNVDLAFANSAPVPIINNGMVCHGCDMVLEYVIDEPVIFKKLLWGNQEFTIKIITLAEIPYFVFDQPTKRIFFVVISNNDSVTMIIPLDLLENPYDVYLNENKILKHELVQNATHARLNFRADSSGAVDIIGSKVVGEGPIMKTPEKIIIISKNW